MPRHLPVPVGLALHPDPVAPAAFDDLQDLPRRFPGSGLRPLACVRAPWLDRLADSSGGTQIHLALENLQTTGSFKVRGALCALDALRRQGAERVVAASAGNHGAGIAHAARVLGMQATVFVPAGAPASKASRIEGEGATIVRVPGGYDAAEAAARAAEEREAIPFVSPYDDDHVLAGNGASLGFELIRCHGRIPDAVVVPIGGGGLASGMALALARHEGVGAPRRVWTVQSEVCAAFALSVSQGEAIETMEASAPTLADGLEGGISARAFARAASCVAGVSVVSEAMIGRAMQLVRTRLDLRIEGSSATVVALAMGGLPSDLRGGDAVLLLTGRNVKETHRDLRPE